MSQRRRNILVCFICTHCTTFQNSILIICIYLHSYYLLIFLSFFDSIYRCIGVLYIYLHRLMKNISLFISSYLVRIFMYRILCGSSVTFRGHLKVAEALKWKGQNSVDVTSVFPTGRLLLIKLKIEI